MIEMINWYPGLTIAECERENIERTLRFYGGNKTHAAASLGISIKTLYNKLKEYNMEDQDGGREVELPKQSQGKLGESGVSGQPAKMENGTSGIEPKSENVAEAQSRVRVESPPQVSKKQSMPLRKRA